MESLLEKYRESGVFIGFSLRGKKVWWASSTSASALTVKKKKKKKKRWWRRVVRVSSVFVNKWNLGCIHIKEEGYIGE